MLSFKRLKLTNFCQHRDLQMNFEPGVIGILGNNGSGKSNLIKGLFRALTGKALNPGKKEDDITWGEKSGSLELEFMAGGNAGLIKRDLKTARCSMTLGEDKIKQSSKIDECLYPFIGVTPRVLADTIFVMQGKLEGILFQPPSERMQALQHLFGTFHAERIRELLHDELMNLSIESREDSIRQFKTRLTQEIEPPLKEAEETVQVSEKAMLDTERRKALEEIAEQHRQAQSASVAIGQLQTSLKGVEEGLRARRAAHSNRVSICDQAVSAWRDLEPEVAKLEATVEAFKRYEELLERHTQLKDEMVEAETILNEPAPTIGFDEAELDAKQQKLSTLGTEREQWRAMVAYGNARGASSCPTCGQEVGQEHLLEAALKLDRTKEEFAALDSEVKAKRSEWSSYQRASASHSERLANAQRRFDSLKVQLEKLPVAEEVDEKEASEAADLLKMAADLKVKVQKAEEDVRVSQNGINTLQEEHTRRLSELEAMKSQTGNDPGSEAYESAKKELDAHAQAVLACERAKGIITTLTQQKTSVENQIAKWEEDEKKLVKLKEWKEHLEGARTLLHRDALPRQVVRSYLGAMNERLRHYLELFGSTFVSVIDEDGTVTCMFSSSSCPAERLSGGQRVVLGIAFRFAVYDLFVADLGVMILDEPTAWLDDANVQSVAELLNHVKSYARAARIQLFVITHEQELVGSFDQIISIKA